MGRALRFSHWILIGLAAFCALAIDIGGVRQSVFKDDHYVGDFTVFWTAARMPPNAVYDLEAISRAQAPLIGGYKGARPFVNPPSLLPWLAPFGEAPFFMALALWVGFGAVALGWIVWRLVPWRVAPLIAIAPPSVLAIATGQVAPVIWAAVVTGLWQVQRRPLLAGALIGLAATMKPQSVLLAPVALVAGRHWRALIAALATGVAIGLTCVAIQGPHLWLDWLHVLAQFGDISQRFYLMRRGATPANLAYLLGLSGGARLVLIGAGAVLGVAVVWLTFRASEDLVLRVGALAAGSILCAPYAMPYEAIPLLPAAALMLTDPKRPLLWLPGFLLISQLLLPVGVLAVAMSLLWLACAPRQVLPLWGTSREAGEGAQAR